MPKRIPFTTIATKDINPSKMIHVNQFEHTVSQHTFMEYVHFPETSPRLMSPRYSRDHPERVNILQFYETVPETGTFPRQSPNTFTYRPERP
jgi:hypothetical protein